MCFYMAKPLDTYLNHLRFARGSTTRRNLKPANYVISYVYPSSWSLGITYIRARADQI